MPSETPNTIPVHYVKSNAFRVLHTDGVIGSVTPAGLIFVGIYSERIPLPDLTVHTMTPKGQIGEERFDDRVNKKGIMREVEVGALMSVETANTLVAWLQEQIDLLKKVKRAGEQERKDAMS